jgi:hypothetical protein
LAICIFFHVKFRIVLLWISRFLDHTTTWCHYFYYNRFIMSSSDSKASSTSDVSSTELLGTIAIKGHPKRRRMMTNKELTGAARKKPRTQLLHDPKPPVKSSMIDPSVAMLAQSDDDSLEEGQKGSKLPSSTPASVAGLIQRPPVPPRLTSTISSEVEDLAGFPRVTDVPAFLSRSYESDSGDEATKWPQQSGSQRIMSIPRPPGQHGHEGIETTDSAALSDASETLIEPLLVPHSVLEDLGVNDGRKKRRGKNKVSTQPKVKLPKDRKATNPKTVKPP